MKKEIMYGNQIVGYNLTCKNSNPYEIWDVTHVQKIFSRAEYLEGMEGALDGQVKVPTLDTLLRNGFAYPVAYETYYVQNEYFEAVECYRYFYRFNVR